MCKPEIPKLIGILDEAFTQLPIASQIEVAKANEREACEAKDWMGAGYWQGVKHYLWILERKKKS